MSGYITNPVIKKLYALSAGKCNICKISLFEKDVHIGEMAHVIAKSPKGTRGDLSSINNNSYENLILLCANDHIRVDNDSVTFPVERLLEIKNDHESFIANVTDFSPFALKKRKNDIEFLNAYFYYTPFGRVRGLIDTLPSYYHIHLDIFDDMFDSILKDLPAHYPLNDNNLQEKFKSFIQAYKDVDCILHSSITTSNGYFIETFSGANHNHICHFNYSNLPYDKSQQIEVELIKRRNEMFSAYDSLLSYIRGYYPEVEIYSPNF